MKLKCKCNKPLTTEVSFSKHLLITANKMKTGFFRLLKRTPSYNNKWSEDHPAQIMKALPKRIMIPEGNILDGVIPEYYTGCGCCHHDGGELKCTECGRVIGWMSLDCWQLGSVDFYEKNVVRYYDN